VFLADEQARDVTSHGELALDAAGRIVGAVSVLQDVAQLRALDRAKDEFLSVAAHELRNPLTSLRGNLQLLQRRVQKDPARGDESTRLDAIIAQSDRLAQLVGRLLDVSRAELGRLDLELGPADAAAVVRRVVDGARGLSADHPVVAATPDRVPVVWDELRIEQVLANLVGNAVKHTPGGEIAIALVEHPDGTIRIAVRDQGPGIPDSTKGRLFERYFRAGTEAADGGADGLGLGLYISRLIARAHGGDLTIADAPAGGALFTLVVPRQAVPAPTGTAAGRDRRSQTAMA
jgi:two-component system phosphate regulon sensor histidine kinase PhoR